MHFDRSADRHLQALLNDRNLIIRYATKRKRNKLKKKIRQAKKDQIQQQIENAANDPKAQANAGSAAWRCLRDGAVGEA